MDTLYHWLWIFFLYAFLGWCSEVVFAAVKTGTFVNRGFLLGPVCPIYGMGVIRDTREAGESQGGDCRTWGAWL